MKMGKSSRFLLAGVATLALVASADRLLWQGNLTLGPTAAFAQGQGQGGSGNAGGNSDSSGGNSGNAGGNAGGQGGSNAQGGNTAPGGGDADSDGKGPQANQPTGDQGGSPPWAEEGIPEVELGRLNVIRSPDAVLDRALTETLANFDEATMADLYELSATAFASTIAANWDTITIIDSPLENLALLTELWDTGTTSLPGVTPSSTTDLAAIFIGVASDKYIPVDENTVLALSVITGTNLTSAEIAAIAAKAEIVRIAVLEGHG